MAEAQATPKPKKTAEQLKQLRQFHAIRTYYEQKRKVTKLPSTKRRRLNFDLPDLTPEEEAGTNFTLYISRYFICSKQQHVYR